MGVKPARLVDKALLARVREMPCFICGERQTVHPHHLTTRGAGGGDTEDNLLPLCIVDHVAIHKMGIGRFIEKHPRFLDWLEKHGRFDLIDRANRISRRDGDLL